MSEVLAPDLCIIGSGTAGGAIARAAAGLGAQVVLIEKGDMGGAHPGLALRAFADAASRPGADYASAQAAAQRALAQAAAEDAETRWRALGVQVIRAPARFVSRDRLEAGGIAIAARRFVVATGAEAAQPRIPGLEQIRPLTPAALLARPSPPRGLVILGAGAEGVELALACRRVGAAATLIDPAGLLTQEDPEFALLIGRGLRRAGVDLRCGAAILGCEARGDGFALRLEGGATIEGGELALAGEKRPRLGGLGLEAAGVALTTEGAALRKDLRTANRRIFVAGAAAGVESDEAARLHAGFVLRAALLRWPARLRPQHAPRHARAAPDFAATGLTEAQARKAHRRLRIVRAPLGPDAAGHVKLILTRGGRILGAAILGAGAGEAIAPYQLALQRGLKAAALADVVLPPGPAAQALQAALQAAATGAPGGVAPRGRLGLSRKFG